ncbi:MAG: inositol monophosphatase family protein [Acidimicrobiales bacterium]
MEDDQLIRVCHDVVDAVERALATVGDWAPAGQRSGQYAIDLVADEAALSVLRSAGLGVLSEESGAAGLDAPFVAVIDPVDGSTNASRGVPWFASSICIVDEAGPRAAVVANLARGVRYHAVRGGGAWRDGSPLSPSPCTRMTDAVVGLSGYPRRHMGWAQYRAFGAAALDLCAVAEGTIDAFAAVGMSHLGPWDYLGGVLLCTEAGAAVADLDGGELLTLQHGARRAVAAAATPELLEDLQRAVLASRPGN